MGPALTPMTAEIVAERLAGRHGAPDDPRAPITIEATHITGTLALSSPAIGATGRPLRFVGCRFAAQIDARALRAPSLTLSGCVLPGLELADAELDRLELDGCRLGSYEGRGGLDAIRLVARAVTLRGGTARGHGSALRFDSARLDTLHIVDAVAGPSGETLALRAAALCCDRLLVENSALTSIAARGLVVETVRLLRPSIVGHCDLEGVVARVIEVVGGAIGGSLRLERARVQGNVGVAGVTLGSGKLALLADHAVIEGSLMIGDDPRSGSSLVARGAVRLRAAVIEQLGVSGRIEQLGGLDLRRARIETVTLAERAAVAGLHLDRARLGALTVEPGARLTAPARGRGFRVAGPVLIDGAVAGDDVAVDFAGGRFDDSLHFGEEFTCDGAVLLDYCEVAGDVVVRGEVRSPRGNVLDMAGLRCERLTLDPRACEGGVSIRRSECSALTLRGEYRCPDDLPLHIGVACKGRIAIGDATRPTRVAGTLSLIDSTCRELLIRQVAITAPFTGRWTGMALAARHFSAETLARIGHADDREGVRASGAIALDYARFGDDLRLVGVEASALSLRSASVKGDTVLGEAGERATLSIAGMLDLAAAELGGDLRLGAITFGAGDGGGASGLSLTGASVAGALRVGVVRGEQAWTADLDEASVETLDDRHGMAWIDAGGPAPRLAAASLRYKRLAELGAGSDLAHEEAITARLAWIVRHAAPAEPRFFRSAPYHTLASVLAEHGDQSGVKRVEVAARRARRRGGARPWHTRLGDWLFDVTSGYGYSPGRALVVLLVYFAIGWLGTTLAARQGAFEPSPKLESGYIAAAVRDDPRGCVWLEPALYAIDVMLPVVSLDDEKLCSIRADQHGWTWARAVYRIIGSIIVSVALLTFSGLLERDRD